MMALIRDDLALLGVRHDVFASERALVDAGAIDECLAALEERGLIYTGVLEPPKGKRPTIGSRGRRPCSAPPNSATTSTGRSRNPMARGPISPPTSPITATNSAAALPI